MDLGVSVALCTRDSGRYLEEQLRSIAEQTILPGEVIVSDDASSDGTVAAVEAWASAVSFPVTVLRNRKALGVTANFEQAVRACRGDLIALSDHDDVWHPDRIAAAIALFAADPDLLLVHTDARLIDGAGQSRGGDLLSSLRVRRSERRLISSGRGFEALIRRNLVTGATATFRRRLLDLALPFPPEWVHDEWLAIIAGAVGSVRTIPRPLIDYRVHGGNQIGVTRPTLRNDVARLREARGGRYGRLAARDAILVDRLEELPVTDGTRDLARRKRDFDEERASWPASRVRRVALVLRHLIRGDYRRLSSQGSLDVARDLLQPEAR